MTESSPFQVQQRPRRNPKKTNNPAKQFPSEIDACLARPLSPRQNLVTFFPLRKSVLPPAFHAVPLSRPVSRMGQGSSIFFFLSEK